MAIAIRGTTPGITTGGGDPTSVVLNGARQPATNDVLLIIHCNDFYDYTNMSTPTVAGSSSGVTAIAGASFDGGSNGAHTKSWYYVVGSTGDLTVAVDETGTADEEKALIAYVLSGADTAAPIEASAHATTSAGLSHAAPSVSPASSDAFLICHLNANANSGATTPPGSMAEQYDTVVLGSMTVTGATEQLAASGATGTRTFTSVELCVYQAFSIAVKTADAAPPPELEAGPVVNVTRSSNRFA